MDFLNRALAQFNELFRSMTIGARITAGALVAIVVISLVWLFRYESSSPDMYLLGGTPLSASDITLLESAFGEAKLNSYVVDGNRIRVPRSEKAQYMAAAAEKKALPRDFGSYIDEALSNQGILPDDRHQREERVKNAKQKELSQIISRMHGIERATASWDVETKRGLNPEVIKTAMVSVKPAGSASLDDTMADNIRHLVTGMVAGLNVGSVKVVDENTGRVFYGDANSASSPLGDPYYARKRLAEQEWTSKILSAISYVRGVTVGVNVELDKEMRRRETQNKLDPKGVVSRRIEKNRSRTRDGSTPGGRAGFEANGRQAVGAGAGKGSHEEEEETYSTEDSETGRTAVETEVPGLTPTRVTASIGVPVSYFEEIWRKRNPAQTGEEQKKPSQTDLDQLRKQEITKIQSAVVALLPQPPKTTDKTPDVTQLVTVTEFQDIPPEPTPVVGLPERTLDWMQYNWTTLGLIFLGGLSLMVLRSVARAVPAAPPRPSSPSIALDLSGISQPITAPLESAPAAEADAAEAASERRARRSTAARSLRDELSQMVTDDPDAAAGVLRTWIGNIH